MGYSAQVMQRARQRLENTKAEKESLYEERLRIVYAQLPRVRQIDVELRKTMALATQAIFSGAPGDALEQVKTANLALQKERETLINQAFGEGFLDDSPVCTRCEGFGYIGTQMCSCLQELCRQEQKNELVNLKCGKAEFADFKLEYYPDRFISGSNVSIRSIMQKTFQDCRSYALNFGAESGNLLFSGDTGLGKTFLSACIASVVVDRGYSVAYESAVHLFDLMERARFAGDEAAILESQRLMDCDLLIVDDLGTEMAGQFVTTALYTLINDRILKKKATVISTNLTAEEMEKRYSTQILSRLRGNYKRVAFVGDDIRVLKNRGVIR